MDTTDTAFPVRVTGRLDPGVSRGLWLVKWLLLVPHVIVLALLGIAFWVLTVVAFFAILVTARYPRTIFGFNVGVLRWGWRVAFYGYGANGTDRYPPFTLRDVPDYPARLEVDYPDRLSRGLVLVKWWLLAIPHYLVLAFLVGAGGTIVARIGTTGGAGFDGGLVTLLVLIAVIALLFTGRYPRGLFDAVVGMDRWVLRVTAYASLMTDTYPPFRLDQGPEEPALPPARAAQPECELAAEPGTGRGGTTAVLDRPATATPVETAVPPPSAGRSVLLTFGALVVAIGLALAGTGLFGLVTDRAGRDTAGFVTTGARPVSTAGHALVAGPVVVPPVDAQTTAQLVGRVGVTAVPTAGRPLFVGIGPTSDVERYLSGVGRAFVSGATDPSGNARLTETPGGAPPGPPAAQPFWTTRVQGDGAQTVSWTPQPGAWSLVVMNADGSAPVATTLVAAAQVPVLGVASAALLVTGAGLLVVGLIVVVVAALPRREPAGSVRR